MLHHVPQPKNTHAHARTERERDRERETHARTHTHTHTHANAQTPPSLVLLGMQLHSDLLGNGRKRLECKLLLCHSCWVSIEGTHPPTRGYARVYSAVSVHQRFFYFHLHRPPIAVGFANAPSPAIVRPNTDIVLSAWVRTHHKHTRGSVCLCLRLCLCANAQLGFAFETLRVFIMTRIALSHPYTTTDFCATLPCPGMMTVCVCLSACPSVGRSVSVPLQGLGQPPLTFQWTVNGAAVSSGAWWSWS